MDIPLRVKYKLSKSDFNKTWIFKTDFRNILTYQISLKSVQWEPSCSMRADVQTDKMQLIVAIRKFLERASKAQFKT